MQTGKHAYQQQLEDFIRANALPPDKFSHQARLYSLAVTLAGRTPFDDDIVHAAVWLHDLGVFVGHRPEDPAELAKWDHVQYVLNRGPGLLQSFGFPQQKIAAVMEAIRTHQPADIPTFFEAVLIRDADILEQLGAVGILRTVSKVGRDTRFVRFSDAIRVLQKNLEELPGKLRLENARKLAEPRILALERFLAAAATESGGLEW